MDHKLWGCCKVSHCVCHFRSDFIFLTINSWINCTWIYITFFETWKVKVNQVHTASSVFLWTVLRILTAGSISLLNQKSGPSPDILKIIREFNISTYLSSTPCNPRILAWEKEIHGFVAQEIMLSLKQYTLTIVPTIFSPISWTWVK